MNIITVATHNELPTTLTTRRFSDTPASPMPLEAVVARLGYEPPVVYRWAQYWCVPVAKNDYQKLSDGSKKP